MGLEGTVSEETEFELIARLFAPLAGPGGLGLVDDAAVISPKPGFDLVLTKDAIASGVHFLETDPGDGVAKKLLRVNLSDLAAKGARPLGYLLATGWGAGTDQAFMEAFALGLGEDQRIFDCSLLGGDTIREPGPSVFSLTAVGEVPAGRIEADLVLWGLAVMAGD